MTRIDPLSVPFEHGLHRVADHCYAWLQPPGGFCLSNAGLIAAEGESMLIDTLIDTTRTQKMLDCMAAAEPAAHTINVVVNTHGDIDHTSGNCLLINSRRIMSTGAARHYAASFQRNGDFDFANAPEEFNRLMTELGFDKFDRSSVSYLAPTETFEGSLDVRIGDKAVRLVEFGPAHTPGDTVIHAAFDGVVYAGDLMFCKCHPVMGHWPINNWLRAFDSMLGWDVETFVPGHGPVCGSEEVQRHKDYILFLQDEARRRYDRGMSVSDASYDIFLNLGRFDYLLRADTLRKNVNILYHQFAGTAAKESFIDHSVERMRFRDRIRGRAPGIHVDHIPDGN